MKSMDITHSTGRRKRKDRLIAALMAAAVALVVAFFAWMFLAQSAIREYRNQIRFLDPSWMCIAEYQDTKVVLDGENHKKLLNVLERCSRKFVMGEPAVTDTVSFTFRKDGVQWDMEISKTDQDCLKLDLTGEKEYHMYIPQDNYYETIVELSGPEGKGTPNKAVGKAN